MMLEMGSLKYSEPNIFKQTPSVVYNAYNNIMKEEINLKII